MKTQLSIQERLKDLRVENGLTLEQLSQQTKIPASTLGSYESDDYKEIPHRNIFDLAKFYGVSADYQLGMTENRQLGNISISDLHLSDAALSLLKDRKLNTLLLSELITHEQFRKLMLDLEIYVDGLADMQVKSLKKPGKVLVGYLARGVALIQLFNKSVQLLVPLLCLADFLLTFFDGLFLVLVGRFPDALCKLLFIVPHIPAHALDNGKNGGFYLRPWGYSAWCSHG